jgi:hypothetical protein
MYIICAAIGNVRSISIKAFSLYKVLNFPKLRIAVITLSITFNGKHVLRAMLPVCYKLFTTLTTADVSVSSSLSEIIKGGIK